MNLRRFPSMCVLLACVAGLAGCAQTAVSQYDSDHRQPNPGIRGSDFKQRPSYHDSYQSQVDANSRVGEHTK